MGSRRCPSIVLDGLELHIEVVSGCPTSPDMSASPSHRHRVL